MIIIFITVLLTVILMQNTDRVKFTFLFSDFYMPKLIVLAIVAIVAFILGILVGRPKRVRSISGDFPDSDRNNEKTDTLSNEDREYIN